jgi:chromosome partitioning protein
MKTIAISLQKGGSGKTSLAVSLAVELAGRGNTLLVDCDPQGNASAWIGPDNLTAELAGVLFKKYPIRQAITETATPGLSLLPSAGLGGELKVFMERTAPGEPFCMQDLISAIAAQGFRYCILDMSPAFGTFEREAVTAANEVITPIIPTPFCVDGLQIFSENIVDARQKMHTQNPAYSKIVIAAVDNRIKQHGAIVADIQSKGKDKGLSIYSIPVDQVYRRAQTARQTIQAIGDAKPETMNELRRLAVDIGGNNG